MSWLLAEAMSASGWKDCRSGHSIFDWPLHTQTSPTSTLFRVTESSAVLMVSTSGPPALSGRSLTDHLLLRVVAETVWPRNFTVTTSPSWAQPQIVTGTPCCRTMLSENNSG